ncbi:MAG TPA: aldo/keto reductase [bacterium]|nr:aldo/keto reductase [bacterium]
MEYRQLARTDLKVSRVCFGTMTFGRPVDQITGGRMIERCMEAGIDFFDTANAYQSGEAERILGNALLGKRKGVVLSTKVWHKMGEGPDESGLSRAAILRQAEESLRRLQTDYLDIYFLHRPDYAVPIEETLEAMDTLVRQGKIRYVGTSNYAAWQICEMLWHSEKNGHRPPLIAQPMYNLVARGIEQEYLPMAEHLGVSTIVYNALAGGLLTGKHSPGTYTPGGRFDAAFWGSSLYRGRYWHPQTFAAVDALKKVAADAGRSLSSLAINWLLHHTAADSVLLGASRMEQLEQNLAICEEGPLSPETVKACDEVWQDFRGPIPVYNQ